jgi:hypothetical protein
MSSGRLDNFFHQTFFMPFYSSGTAEAEEMRGSAQSHVWAVKTARNLANLGESKFGENLASCLSAVFGMSLNPKHWGVRP